VPKSVLYVPIFWEFFAPEFDESGRFTKDYLQKLENHLKEFAVGGDAEKDFLHVHRQLSLQQLLPVLAGEHQMGEQRVFRV
jgi:hypothetical protein